MPTSTLFPPEIERHRSDVDEALARYCDFEDLVPERLAEAIRYVLLAPGKRIRPLLVISAAKACGATDADAMPAACAVEMIHNYSLIHDDLPAMDDDDLRRGRPTCHIAFDEATAILAGDALIPMAFGTIAASDLPAERIVDAIAVLARAAGAANLVGGQVDDMAAGDGSRDVAVLEHIHRRKTGALLSVSLELGAIVAGGSTENRQNLIEFGQHLGLAFQIVDDLLDFRGCESKMGKKTGQDLRLGKMTYPAIIGATESERLVQQHVDEAVEKIRSLGEAAHPLEQLARFVGERTS